MTADDFTDSTLLPLDEWMDFIIHEWLKTNLHHKKEMDNSKHYFNPDTINPWHMEDSVWTHTMMVCTAYKSHFPSRCITFAQAAPVVLFCLLHDYGKVKTRHLDPVKMKARFSEHGPHGVLNALEYTTKFLNKFKDKIPYKIEREEILQRVCYITSRHMEYKGMADSGKLCKFSNYNEHFMEDFYKFSVADCAGRIMLKERNDGERSKIVDIFKYHFEDLKEMNFLHWETNATSPRIWIYCGIPGSGKDYQATKAGLKIFSYDQIRFEHYKAFSSKYDRNKSEAESYSEAYEYFVENNINLDPMLVKRLKDHRDENGGHLVDIAICNVNLSLKARRRILHNIRSVYPNADVGCRFVLTPLEQAVKNDAARSCKHLGQDLIEKRFSEIVLPTMLEGFSYVEYLTPFLEDL